MNCIDDNSIIITIAIEVHGIVTNVDLPPEISNIFRDVRWFSKAGDYAITISRQIDDDKLNNKLNKIFTKDLTEPTINVINQYINIEKPEYKSYLLASMPIMDYTTDTPFTEEKHIENICRVFGNITVDKILTKKTSEQGFHECIRDFILPDISGIFLISIHRKINEDEYRLIYPRSPSHTLNMDLFNIPNIEKLATFFGTYQNISDNIIPQLKSISRQLPDKNRYIKLENDIIKKKDLSEEERTQEISKIRNEYYNLLNEWKIEIENNKITGMKMSEFVKLIKHVCGNYKIYINLLDYSCNPTTPYMPKEQEQYKKYLVPSDIESLPEKRVGGKKSISKRRKKFRKSRNRIKNKTKRKLRKIKY